MVYCKRLNKDLNTEELIELYCHRCGYWKKGECTYTKRILNKITVRKPNKQGGR